VKVHADMTRCIGSGMCTTMAPEVFELDDSGTLHVTTPQVSPDLLDATRQAAACCPVGAISLLEDE
jgi:ferredoxin